MARHPFSRRLALAALATPFLGLPDPAGARTLALSGTATDPDRLARPPGATLRVELIEAGGSPGAVAAVEVPAGPSGPIAFALPVEEEKLLPGRSYVLRARLRAGEAVMMESVEDLAIRPDQPGAVEIAMRRVTGPAAGEGAAGSPAGRWRAEEIGRAPVSPDIAAELDIAPDGGVTGRGGCNQFGGRATVDGAGLRFGALVATQMACAPEILDQEGRFLAALTATTGFRLDAAGRKLHLTGEGGREVMRLAAR